MVGWIILGVIALAITAICLLPVGVELWYEDERLRLTARAAGKRIQLLPKPPDRPPREKKEKKPKAKKEKKPREEKPAGEKKGLPLGLTADDVLEVLKKTLRHLGRFGHKLSVDRFMLHFTASEPDPYYTAMTYAYVNEALCILAPLCRRSFRVRKTDVSTDLDFMANRMRLDLGFALSIRIGQILGLGLAVAFSALGVLLRARRRQKKEARFAAAAAAAHTETDKQTETIQEEERMESNG